MNDDPIVKDAKDDDDDEEDGDVRGDDKIKDQFCCGLCSPTREMLVKH